MRERRKGFWQALERLAGGAVRVEWQEELGHEAEKAWSLLRPVNGLASTYPCTNPLGCECPHRVEELAPGRWLAVCGPDEGCPPIALAREDLLVYAVDSAALCSGIARGLGFVPCGSRKVAGARAERVGTYHPAASSAYLMFPGDSARMMREVERLFCAQPDPFILLTPTGAHCSADVESALRRHRSVHLTLARCLVLSGAGRFTATAVPQGALAEWERRLAQAPDIGGLLVDLRQEIGSVRTEFRENLRIRQRLEQMQGEKLFAFTDGIDPESFRILCSVLAHGDVAKASRALNLSDSTLRSRMAEWPKRGPAYKVLVELVRWRKEIGRKGTVPLNEAVTKGTAASADFAGLLSDVLDELLEMDEENWEEKANALAALLRPYVTR